MDQKVLLFIFGECNSPTLAFLSLPFFSPEKKERKTFFYLLSFPRVAMDLGRKNANTKAVMQAAAMIRVM